MSFRDRMNKAKARKRGWDFEEEPLLIGEYLGEGKRVWHDEEIDTLLIKEEKTGKVIDLFITTVMRSELEQEQPVKGDKLGIKYLGKEKNYKKFLIRVDRGDEEAGDT